MSIGNQIKRIREYFWLSQGEFGKEIGRVSSFVASIELGTGKPSEETICAICDQYGINRTWLETDEGAMFQVGREVPPVDLEHIPDRVRQIRRRHGLTQAEFSQAVKCSRDQITSIEQGRSRASRKLLTRIADEFDVSMVWLLTGDSKIEAERDPEKDIQKITEYLRENEIARLLVLEAMRKDSGIWVRFDRVLHEDE